VREGNRKLPENVIEVCAEAESVETARNRVGKPAHPSGYKSVPFRQSFFNPKVSAARIMVARAQLGVSSATSPFNMNEISSAGPATPAAIPIRTKIPAPIIAPTPIRVASIKLISRLKRTSVSNFFIRTYSYGLDRFFAATLFDLFPSLNTFLRISHTITAEDLE